ncbi:hypothetical protein COLO4_04788 [Corchorus olitorius]|uniref:Uncharacterized protein n=1 Tax=Corchorus olitorius TaxID=93759 RepID=A0A1R3KSR0_9ROSI|nr:hypothetical protein COLO4_04788 [Corchorus olitorius]
MESQKEVTDKRVIMEVESEDSSTEEMEAESPRSVVAVAEIKNYKKAERVHSQVLRIREEDSHLGEDFFGDDKEISNNNKNDGICGGFRPRCRVVVSFTRLTRPILPCSPLSGKNNVQSPCTKAT